MAAVAMFGFGFAMVPIYRSVCDATGIRELARPEAALAGIDKDGTRWVSVQFDGNLRDDLPWHFRPDRLQIKVHPGEIVKTSYEVENIADHEIVGQAVPSFSPPLAGAHFHKLECFCFSRQKFAAGEHRHMPLVFYVDRDLPAEVSNIVLSYSFFEVAGTHASAGQ